MTQLGLVRAGVTRSLATFLARYPGVAVEELLARAGIGPEVRAKPDVTVGAWRYIALFDEAARLTGDAALGLRFAEQLAWSDLGLPAYVAFNSPTLGAALGNACRYLALQHTAGTMRLEVGTRESRLVHTLSDRDVPHRQHSEGVLALMTRLAREGLGDARWAPRAVELDHPSTGDDGVQRAFFGVAPRYDRGRDALVLRTDDLRRPFAAADHVLLPILLRHADDTLARLPSVHDEGAAVRRVVIDLLGTGEATIAAVAERLGTSPRSLQRRLADEGQSFTSLVDEARLALARRYVDDPTLTLTEAAYLLGYSDLSAFSRAFKRWTGKSAIEQRRAGPRVAARRGRLTAPAIRARSAASRRAR